MKRVDFGLKHDYEFQRNWKIVQEVFRKEKVQKKIAVDRIVKGRFQDNLEFAQWFYTFFQRQGAAEDYDAEGRRKLARGANKIKSSGARASGTISRKRKNPPLSQERRKKRKHESSKVTSSKPTNSETKKAEDSKYNRRNSKELENLKATNEKLFERLKSSKGELEAKENELATLFSTAAELEKERDFYYDKALKFEKKMKTAQPNADIMKFTNELLQILYEPIQREDDESPSSAPPQQTNPPSKQQPQNSNLLSSEPKRPSRPSFSAVGSIKLSGLTPRKSLRQSLRSDGSFNKSLNLEKLANDPLVTDSDISLTEK